ncbi:K(+)/H(+) antiporter [Aspergillus tubingensis]|uniref:K+/H+ antiporter n=1 Tax=Aspergillus niger TaxID=5061 RepID=A0A100IG56_ASPNG|nr:K+/H+ antiporter [Aspergillus niger]GLA56382.1 K(+)/H(+) antiporter [Aspergillus tubingensis]GLA75903.1 K(+)/H(+) antiporter [Aspergillus tubingensis]GLA93617.1 K(+)/H(+) antiporter [Aspergillus tubingensis]GLB19874.1 K(+)/H(+) antiporter [Aspergillus tubingensis]
MSSNSTTKVKAQGGILEGSNPAHYDSSNPIVIFIIQAGIIIIFCRLLHWPLSKIRQPRVIAEVIAGVILGPSVMGRIPGFTDAIFPTASIPNLNLVANLGLVLFLFLVGLETNLRFLVSNWRVAVSVSAAGMILPFGLGCAIAYGLYNTFQDEPGTVDINFGTFLLFIGIAMAITAFPVLCRILTELKLLGTNVGVIVLSAGVGNDVVGWILLALCVALVNAGTGLTALWVLLVCVGYILFLTFIFRPLFLRFLRHTGSLQKGPSQSVVAITLLIALASAFFTQIIGIHAIFGGFIIGLLCPHEGGFAIKLTEKIEDLVAALFLPLYFTLSGLQTDLGLLDTGTVWGYVVGIIAIAFTAKVAGGALASRLCGLLWRESFSIGVLMSCKGLVELIVLNIGLQARILSTRTFTMFVVMALVTTFATTPLTVALYPKWYQVKVERWRRGEIDWKTGNPIPSDARTDSIALAKEQQRALPIRKLLVYLRLDGLSSICTLAALLSPNRPPLPKQHPDTLASPDPAAEETATPTNKTEEDQDQEDDQDPKPTLQVHGVRLLELTDRDSSVMTVSELDHLHYPLWDPVVNTFRAFGQWHDLSIVAGVSVVPEHSYADTVVSMARDDSTDLLLLPWSETGSMSEHHSLDLSSVLDDPIATRFVASAPYTAFAESVLRNVRCNVGLLVERTPRIRNNGRGLRDKPSLGGLSIHSGNLNLGGGIGGDRGLAVVPTTRKAHHILLPYFGGKDDRFAVRLVLQLIRNDQVTATVVHVVTGAGGVAAPKAAVAAGVLGGVRNRKKDGGSTSSSSGHGGGGGSGKKRDVDDSDAVYLAALRDSLDEEVAARMVFKKLVLAGGIEDSSSGVVERVVEHVKGDLGRLGSGQRAGGLVVVGRGSVGVDTMGDDGDEDKDGGRGVLGLLGEKLVRMGGGDVLVVQARDSL